MFLLSFYEQMQQWGSQIKDFILENGNNPLLWIGLFLGGLLIFKVVFYALNKNK